MLAASHWITNLSCGSPTLDEPQPQLPVAMDCIPDADSPLFATPLNIDACKVKKNWVRQSYYQGNEQLPVWFFELLFGIILLVRMKVCCMQASVHFHFYI